MSDQEPSAKKLRNAREEGNAGISTYATSAVGFAVAAAVVPSALHRAAGHIAALVKASIAHAGDRDPSSLSVDWTALAGELVTLTAPPLLAVAAASAIVSGTQAGGVLAFKKLFSFKLDIAKGFSNLVSPTRAFAVGRSLLIAGAVSWLAYRALFDHARDIAATVGHVERIAPVAGALVEGLVWDVVFLGLAVGAVDAVITRHQWKKKLRMKPEEVKREHRESEGDPEIKHARKRAHDEMMKAGAINAVRQANVVVVNRKPAVES